VTRLIFRIDTRAPRLARLEPVSGAIVSGDAISVTGECDRASAVTVAGSPALLYGGRFIAARVALAPGVNSIEIVARDSAGNEARSTLKILRDDSAPRLTVSSPKPGTLTREATVTVRGAALDEHLSEILVNGAAAHCSLSRERVGVRGGSACRGSIFEREVRLTAPEPRRDRRPGLGGNCAETYRHHSRFHRAVALHPNPGRGTVAGLTINVEGDWMPIPPRSRSTDRRGDRKDDSARRACRSHRENTITATALTGPATPREPVPLLRTIAHWRKLDLRNGAVRSDSPTLASSSKAAASSSPSTDRLPRSRWTASSAFRACD
jgi:hypothetical protein